MAKRPYKPTRLKLLHGSRGAEKQLEKEPKPAPVAPEMPNDIDRDAQRVWKRLAPMLERVGLLTEVDGDMFGGLCQIHSRITWLNNELKNPDNDEKRRSWLLKEERLYLKLFREYCGEFGLTPRGRVGLPVTADDKDSFFASLLD